MKAIIDCVIGTKGQVLNDDLKSEPDESYTYKACPATVNKLEEELKREQENPKEYSVGEYNCCNWACEQMEDVGITPPYPSSQEGLQPRKERN